MGSPESEANRGDDEGPQVKKAIKPFWMGKYEVTWDEYERYFEGPDSIKEIVRERLCAQ
jgi:formylglycine-generating enzyme required for sulfatase activity